MNEGRHPSAYIIGAQKSGTTSLFDWLGQHPQIFAPPLAKDYPFFSDDECFRDGKQFFSFFDAAPANVLTLGGDANAMFAPEGARRMAEVIPDASLIAILRNPVDRAYSAYCHAVERHMESRSFARAIEEELEGIRYEDKQDSMRRDYLAHGRYAEQLERVLAHFPTQRLHVLIMEEVLRQPEKELCRLFAFLGVDTSFRPELTHKNRTRGRERWPWLSKAVRWRPESAWGRKLAKSVVPFAVRARVRRFVVRINRVDAPKPEFPNEVRHLLVKYYAPEVRRLESLIGRRIAVWEDFG